MATAKPYHVMDGYDFVAYPNRNSVPFREFYKIPEAHTVIRGSLRYEGNPAFVKALIDLGWLDTEQKDWLKDGLTWAEIFQKMTSAEGKDERYVAPLTPRNTPLMPQTQCSHHRYEGSVQIY
jgi:saccharopine dehydrogenase (NADP+, L-glutamate forming)